MKFLLIVAALFVAAQAFPGQNPARGLVGLHKTLPLVEGAPQHSKPRIINGLIAADGQFPYQAGLWLDGRGFCGGSLVTTRHVLTAAHCVEGIYYWRVVLGTTYPTQGSIIIQTTSGKHHENYNANTLVYDIAVIDLLQDVPLSDTIQTIALASGSNLYVGNEGRISGWGKTSDAVNTVSSQLMYADVNVITNNVCAQYYGSVTVIDTCICTQGTNGRSTCNGDSGGPLVDRTSGKLIGVVSFGSIYGCESGAPNGYSRVTAFEDWIIANTQQ